MRLLLLVLLLSTAWSTEVGSARWFIERPDADYARRAALAALAQVQLCRLIDERVDDDPGLVERARQIAGYAGRTAEELERIAGRQGFHLPIELDAEHRLVLDGLRAARPGEFAPRCAEALAAGLRESLTLALDEVERGSDAEFRAFARLDGECWKECAMTPTVVAAGK